MVVLQFVFVRHKTVSNSIQFPQFVYSDDVFVQGGSGSLFCPSVLSRCRSGCQTTTVTDVTVIQDGDLSILA